MSKQSLGIIGVGAFGAFMAKHLAPHFDLVLHDARDVAAIAREHKARVGNLAQVAACDIVVVAVPVQKMRGVLTEIAPMIKPGTLVLDVGSVKIGPTELMKDILPAHAAIVGTHPLFGPQSGKDGIAGMNIAVCNVRGEREGGVIKFLSETLKLKVTPATPQDHDREAAYVQGLTHMIAKIVVSLELPQFQFTTRTYEHLEQMVEMIRYDSDELFKAIERENPFSDEAKKAFFAAARGLEDKLMRD